jgi:peptidoglycan/xylan/chitin deacetylase (PgdA/CDA1 family)
VTRVGRSVFERQMTALAQAGWRTLRLAEFGDPHTTPHAPGTFLLSFDDGYASLADHAFPVLADLGLSATTFLITDFVGRENTWDVRYTWRRLRHLDWPTIDRWRARGFDFASHGAAHRRLTWLDDGAAADDLRRSRETLVARLGAPAGRAVAYPFGAVDDRIQRLAGEAGYEIGFGGVRGKQASRLQLPRVPVYMWDVGDTPFGLQRGGLGSLGRFAAHLANRCAVGTSVLLQLRTERGARSRARR